MRWLDEYLRKQPKGPIATRLQEERQFVLQLWEAAFRAGATAGLSVVGDPDPVELAEQTLEGLTEYTEDAGPGHDRQVQALTSPRGQRGWMLAYFAGWNAALGELEGEAEQQGLTVLRLLDTRAAEARAHGLLSRNRTEILRTVEQQVWRSRLPSAARAATRAAARVTRAAAAKLSTFWPGASDYDLEPRGANAESPSRERGTTRRGAAHAKVISITRQSSHRQQVTPRVQVQVPSAARPSRSTRRQSSTRRTR